VACEGDVWDVRLPVRPSLSHRACMRTTLTSAVTVSLVFAEMSDVCRGF
jgi:hypothetical protein